MDKEDVQRDLWVGLVLLPTLTHFAHGEGADASSLFSSLEVSSRSLQLTSTSPAGSLQVMVLNLGTEPEARRHFLGLNYSLCRRGLSRMGPNLQMLVVDLSSFVRALRPQEQHSVPCGWG